MAAEDLLVVLVVDDDEDTRHAIASVLEDAGCLVATADNGKVAHDMLRTGVVEPDLILLDLMMPVMNGWEFWDLHQQSAFQHIPIVIITASGFGPGSFGQVPVLKKPLGAFDILDAVGALQEG